MTVTIVAAVAGLLGAGIGAGGAIASAALTTRAQARVQHAHWRRQLRRDAYARFLALALDWHRHADKLEIDVTWQLDSREDAIGRLDLLIGHDRDAFSDAGSVVDLEGPPEVTEAAEAVREAQKEWMSALVDVLEGADTFPLRDQWPQEISQKEAAAQQAIRNFRAVARRTLAKASAED
jgi:hypothetical protein